MKEETTPWAGDDFRATIKSLSTCATGFVITGGDLLIVLATNLGRLGGADAQINGVNCHLTNPSCVGKILEKRKENMRGEPNSNG